MRWLAVIALGALLPGCELVQNLTGLGSADKYIVVPQNETCQKQFMKKDSAGNLIRDDKGDLVADETKILAVIKNTIDNASGGFTDLPQATMAAGTSGAGQTQSLVEPKRPHLDDFLDCVIGRIDPPRDSSKAEVNAYLEKRLFRGHVVVTLLARYGAFNITGQVGGIHDIEFRAYPEMAEDAATMIAHIEIAEDLLRIPWPDGHWKDRGANSTAAKLARFGFLRDVNLSYRVISVIQVALDAETPTLRRTKRFVRDVIGAFASRNVAAIGSIATDAANAVAKVGVLNVMRAAYLRDANRYGWAAPDTPGDFKIVKQITLEDWARWDALLVEACDRLAELANVKNHCLSDDEIIAARTLLMSGGT